MSCHITPSFLDIHGSTVEPDAQLMSRSQEFSVSPCTLPSIFHCYHLLSTRVPHPRPKQSDGCPAVPPTHCLARFSPFSGVPETQLSTSPAAITENRAKQTFSVICVHSDGAAIFYGKSGCPAAFPPTHTQAQLSVPPAFPDNISG